MIEDLEVERVRKEKKTKSEFEKVRDLSEGELAFKILMPRKTKTSVCTNDLGDGELCDLRLCDAPGIEGPVCGACNILYRYVGYSRERHKFKPRHRGSNTCGKCGRMKDDYEAHYK